MGLRIPEDLSVVGFDDIQLSHEIDPPLTTVHVHKSWMGSMGVNALIERSRNPGQPKITKVVSTHLVERSTVSFVRSNRISKTSSDSLPNK
jgi:LacI family transcriptional regulator